MTHFTATFSYVKIDEGFITEIHQLLETNCDANQEYGK